MNEKLRRERFEWLLTSELYEQCWGYCCRLSLTSGGGRADAEDLLQETLVYAWRGIGSLRDEAKFKGWLYAIARRRHLTRLTRLRRESDALAEPHQAMLAASPAPSANPYDDLAQEALARLPDGPRELLSLFYLEGLSAAEVGQVLGVAPRAVNMRLSRARALLRRELQIVPDTVARESCAGRSIS